MKIGIVGSGNMGRSLGILWAEQGHQVFFGSRDAEKGKAVAKLAERGTQGGTNDEAIAFADVILWTARGIMPRKLLSNPEVLNGKIVIDCNNQEIPEGFAYPPIVESLAEKLAKDVPNARVVKAFNTMAQEVFELAPEPLRDYGVSVFVAGDDGQARKTVMQLAKEIGFVPIDSGILRNARLVEGLGDFIRLIIIGQQQGAYATISVNILPASQNQRLGGRQASSLN
ncbi:NAD(P)-binding domain-containing protein [Chlorogloeopsis sp. ULAP01]|uniref:NADPH-dependent F420 reductase n=1 Tax=Chlorogloeopsis sp. ULAP01 TaxID=3056483 RepID=UPI0025AAF27C|nr:NAD(P)-binding domain-containing protein [Chlorogloeopsis sp. ULAP01]MDM9384330.1 NAD(P)-binding domain-containing protein [Chlorogloeopsis sp. ULAP01]